MYSYHFISCNVVWWFLMRCRKVPNALWQVFSNTSRLKVLVLLLSSWIFTYSACYNCVRCRLCNDDSFVRNRIPECAWGSADSMQTPSGHKLKAIQTHLNTWCPKSINHLPARQSLLKASEPIFARVERIYGDSLGLHAFVLYSLSSGTSENSPRWANPLVRPGRIWFWGTDRYPHLVLPCLLGQSPRPQSSGASTESSPQHSLADIRLTWVPWFADEDPDTVCACWYLNFALLSWTWKSNEPSFLGLPTLLQASSNPGRQHTQPTSQNLKMKTS